MGNACGSPRNENRSTTACRSKTDTLRPRRRHHFASVVDKEVEHRNGAEAVPLMDPESVPPPLAFPSSGSPAPTTAGTCATQLSKPSHSVFPGPSSISPRVARRDASRMSVTFVDTPLSLANTPPPAEPSSGRTRRAGQHTDALIDMVEAEQALSMSKLAGPMLDSKSSSTVWEDSHSSGFKGSPGNCLTANPPTAATPCVLEDSNDLASSSSDEALGLPAVLSRAAQRGN